MGDGFVEKGKAHLEALEKAELSKLRSDVMKAVQVRGTEEKLSQESLFLAVDKDADGSISKAELSTFLEGCKDFQIESDRLDRLFGTFQLDDKGGIAKDAFLKFVRVVYRVIKETVLTTDRAIKGSKTIRRLEVDECLEVLEGPSRDDKVDVLRVRGVAIKDGLSGWATVVGNNGSIFMEESASDAVGTAPPPQPTVVEPPPAPPAAPAADASVDAPADAPAEAPAAEAESAPAEQQS